MRRRKRVVDIKITERRDALHQRGIVLFLAGVKAGVLQDRNVARLKRRDRGGRLLDPPEMGQRRSQGSPSGAEARILLDRAGSELDGEVELAVCGAIVQVWGTQRWERVGIGRTGCPECARITAVDSRLTSAR